MRIKFLAIISVSILLMNCTPISRNANVCASKLKLLLDQKEYFRLETQLNLCKDDLSESQRLYFQAFVDNAFNRNEASVTAIDTLLHGNSAQLADSIKAALLLLQGDCYFKLYQYEKAAQIDSVLLDNYSNSLDSEKIDDIKNDLLIRNALRYTPVQETTITATTNIKWTRDEIGLIEIPIKHDTTTFSCIFDTRANISSITQTFAKKLGIKMLDVSYDEYSGITGIKFKSRLGIADSLYFDNILIRHAVFQVMPDSILYLAPINFALDVIIGFPVISQLKEVHILKDGRMIIPERQSANDLHNLALDRLDPVLQLESGTDTLCFNFDLGATTTNLYYAFFEKYKQRILSSGNKRTIQLGGAGGIQKKEVYYLPSLELKMGNKEVVLDSVDILTQKIFPGEKFYGNIGNDFTSQFNELVLNFDYMYVKGE